jgi:outer membrane protein assembly factor BamA
MLGNHIVFAGISAVQANELRDLVDNFSGNVLYLNLARRLNYGAGLFRFEGRFRDVAYDIYDEVTSGGYFLASYPFSRFNRVELQLALERSRREDVADFNDEFPVGDSIETLNLSRKGTLASNYLSYIKDNTLWLPTGPIDGQRYNVTVGLVSCFECTYPSEITGQPIARSAAVDNYLFIGDYRHYIRTTQQSAYAMRAYLFLSSGTLPGRAVLGGPHRLRGYPRFSLAGSRVWLLNQEWRFPILHGLSLDFPFGTLRLPGIQGATFADVGSSWLESQTRARGTWGSYGLGFRTSLGAPLVLRLDVGRRFRTGALPPVVFGNGERFNDTFVDFFFGFNY